MNRRLRLISMLPLALVALSFLAPAARAQTAKQPPTAIVSLYRIAPGKHLDFLKWVAEQDAINKEAGLPAAQIYVHTDGDSWDYLGIAPELSKDQQAKVDEVARKRGRKTGFAASLEFRTFASWHTDTFTMGPTTAADLVAAASK